MVKTSLVPDVAKRSRELKSDEQLDPPAEYPQYALGYYAVFFADPDGLKLEFVHMPSEPEFAA